MTNTKSKISTPQRKVVQRIINVSFVILMAVLFTSFLNKKGKDLESKAEVSATAVSANPYIGEIAVYPYNFAPRGWAKCDGQLLPINQNQALFSLLGTTFGGDGRTTFALPDLRGRVVISYGSGPGLPTYRLGEKGGLTNTTLTATDLAAHTHAGTIKAKNGSGDESNPGGGYLATAPTDFYAETHNTTMAGDAVTVGSTGNGQAFTNMQPYLTLGYYIALQGTFPSRN